MDIYSNIVVTYQAISHETFQRFYAPQDGWIAHCTLRGGRDTLEA